MLMRRLASVSYRAAARVRAAVAARGGGSPAATPIARPPVAASARPVNVIILRPSDQPRRPDLELAFRSAFHGPVRDWYQERAGRTWTPGSFRSLQSTHASEEFVDACAHTAIHDLQYNLGVPLFPNAAQGLARPGFYTPRGEITIIMVQTNQNDCDYGAFYDFRAGWGIVVEGGTHLLKANRTPAFDANLPPWNTRDPSSRFYGWQQRDWVDPIQHPENPKACYRPEDELPRPTSVMDAAYWYRHTLGVMAHETGHALGLDHPDSRDPDFNTNLMGAGWLDWPDCGLRRSQLRQLQDSPFLTVAV